MEKLKLYMKLHDLSLRDMAARAGLSQTYIHMLVQGKANPTLRVMRKIEEGTAGQVPASVWLEDAPSEKL